MEIGYIQLTYKNIYTMEKLTTKTKSTRKKMRPQNIPPEKMNTFLGRAGQGYNKGDR